MSKTSSNSSDKGGSAFGDVKWRMLGQVAAGLACVFLASYVAQRAQLGRTLMLDMKGERAAGSAEVREDGAYHLRYKHPDGDIFRRVHRGGLGVQRPDESGAVTIAFNPEDGSEFQPATISYKPGVVALGLFLAGLVFVLGTRRTLLRAKRGAKASKQDAPKRAARKRS
ncbi:MAG: hypothetical protein GY851_06035 [bacterium]|nr:hypothetical protein [bacterium]